MSDMVNTVLFNKKNTLQKRISLNMSVRDIIYLALCYLMSGCSVFAEKTPFGLGAYAACFSPGKWIMFFVSSVLGLLRFRMDYEVVLYIIPLACATLFMGVFKSKIKIRAFAVSGFLFVSSLCANIVSGFFWYDCFLALLEAVLCFASVYVFSSAVPLAVNANERKCVYDTELISLYVLGALLIKLTTRFPMFLGMDVSIVLSIVTIYIISLEGDISLGTAMGIVLGMITVDRTDSITASIGAFALVSFCSGILKRYGKWGVVAGFVFAHTVMVAFFAGEILPFDIFEIILASLIFAVLPKRVTKYLSSFSAKTVHIATSAFIEEDKMQSVISKKLKRMSESYRALSGAYSTCSKENNITKGYIIRMIDSANSKVCRDCGLKYNCWERGYKQSYKAMFEMLETAEEKGIVLKEDVPEEISSKCTKLDNLVDAFNRMFDVYKTEKIYSAKLNECRSLMSCQMEEVANSVSDMAGEFELFPDIPTEKELNIRLDTLGIGVSDVIFLSGRDKNFVCEVAFDKWDITKKDESLVKNCIEELTNLKVSSRGVNHTKNTATLTLGPKNAFNITVGKAAVCKSGEKVSGDSMLVCQDRSGKMFCAISDGMGTGECASKDSTLAIALLGNFISSGMDIKAAVRLINSSFLLGCSSENFVTLDVCSVDLNSGLINFYKTASPSAYVKEDNKVYKSQMSYPASVLLQGGSHMAEDSYEVSGSALAVLLSDGVYDVFNSEKQDELINLLEKTDFVNPQITASKIISTALEMSENKAKDDMSVIVLNIWKDE